MEDHGSRSERCHLLRRGVDAVNEADGSYLITSYRQPCRRTPTSAVTRAHRARTTPSSAPSRLSRCLPHSQLASFSSYNRPLSVVFLSSLSSSSWPSVQDQPKHSPSPPYPNLYRLPAFNNLVLTHKINEVQTDAVLLLVETLFANSSALAEVSGLSSTSASS